MDPWRDGGEVSFHLYQYLGEPYVMPKPHFIRPTTVVRLEQWAVHRELYAAPESPNGRIYLSGEVYGYPGRADGEQITTGHVYDAEGTIAYGRRTAYQLGTPHPRYLAFLAGEGIDFDPANPIRMVN